MKLITAIIVGTTTAAVLCVVAGLGVTGLKVGVDRVLPNPACTDEAIVRHVRNYGYVPFQCDGDGWRFLFALLVVGALGLGAAVARGWYVDETEPKT